MTFLVVKRVKQVLKRIMRDLRGHQEIEGEESEDTILFVYR